MSDWRHAAAIRAQREAEPLVAPGFAWSCGTGGELCMALNETAVRMRPSGALWIEAARMLVAGDLHLEKGSSYAARGQFLPPYDTRATLERLEREVVATSPAVLVLLGDTFHDRGAEARLAGDDAARLTALARGRTLVWVVGNHDPDAPDALPGETADELTVEGLTLWHEPRPGPWPGEVSGHLHPCARVVGRSGTVRKRAFLTDGSRLILPAFGAYAGGLNCRDRAFAGLWDGPVLAGVMGRDKVHAVGWGSLVGD